MNKKGFTTKQLVTLGLLTALVLIMCMTPLGTLPIGPLSITLNMIPIAIAAIAVGPVGGLVVGSVFGMFSFCQALGIGVPSAMGVVTFGISPFLTFVQRVVSRAFVGLLLGYIFIGCKKIFNRTISAFITGFFAALLNYIFFMGMLVLFFQNADEIASYWAGRTIIAYLIATFLSNTIFEIIVTTILTGVVTVGLSKARLLNTAD